MEERPTLGVNPRPVTSRYGNRGGWEGRRGEGRGGDQVRNFYGPFMAVVQKTGAGSNPRSGWVFFCVFLFPFFFFLGGGGGGAFTSIDL